jgi:hypothetical protein
MAEERNVRPGYVVIYPNRDKASAKLVRLLVALLLLGSAFLMALITLGGWSDFAGLKPANLIIILIYIALAVYIWIRWARGLLPMAAFMGILILMMAVVSTFGMAGTSWFDRSHTGFAHAQSLFGSTGFSADILGTLTVLLIFVEIALIVVAMIGFSQGWNVEQEVPEDEAKVHRGDRSSGQARPATA